MSVSNPHLLQVPGAGTFRASTSESASDGSPYGSWSRVSGAVSQWFEDEETRAEMQELLKAGNESLQRGEVLSAIVQFEEILEKGYKSPAVKEGLKEAGDFCFKRGDFFTALRAYVSARAIEKIEAAIQKLRAKAAKDEQLVDLQYKPKENGYKKIYAFLAQIVGELRQHFQDEPFTKGLLDDLHRLDRKIRPLQARRMIRETDKRVRSLLSTFTTLVTRVDLEQYRASLLHLQRQYETALELDPKSLCIERGTLQQLLPAVEAKIEWKRRESLQLIEVRVQNLECFALEIAEIEVGRRGGIFPTEEQERLKEELRQWCSLDRAQSSLTFLAENHFNVFKEMLGKHIRSLIQPLSFFQGFSRRDRYRLSSYTSLTPQLMESWIHRASKNHPAP